MVLATIETDWTSVKNFCTTKGVLPQYVVIRDNYHIFAWDGPFSVYCFIPKMDPASTDQTDFETNYLSISNKTIVQNSQIQSMPFIGAKTLQVNGVTKRLFSRDTGVQQALTAGDNVIDYTATFAWSKVVGIEVMNCEALDVASLSVYDTATGTYSGVPNYKLNQFGFSMNMPKDYYRREARFDADIYPGMIIRVNYNSVSAKTIGLNIWQIEVKT